MPIGASQAPYAKYEKPGDRHGGTIVDFRVVQTADFDSGRPLYLKPIGDGKYEKSFDPYGPDGVSNDPICQWEITVDTGIEDEYGDTERRIFVDPRKGKKNTLLEGRRGGDAVAIALKKARCHRIGLEIGATFYYIAGPKVKDGTGPATNTWEAEYAPPPEGPGTGRPVDEQPWLIGGGRYVRHTEARSAPAGPPARDPAGEYFAAQRAQHDPASHDPTGEAIAGMRDITDQLRRVHDSSPVLNRDRPVESRYDDEPPF